MLRKQNKIKQKQPTKQKSWGECCDGVLEMEKSDKHNYTTSKTACSFSVNTRSVEQFRKERN